MSKSKNLATFSDNVDSSGNIIDLNVDSNTLVVDAANNRVGIGTAPNKKLHVYRNDTSTDAQILVEQAGIGDATVNFLKTGVYAWMTGIDNTDNKYKISGSGDDLNTNNYLAIDTSGNVGIGTNAPTTKLDVNGDLRVQGNFTVDGTTTTINSTTLNVDDLNITVASGAADAAAANGAGITVDGASATLTYVNAGDNWSFNKDLNLDGDLTVGGGQINMPNVATKDKYRVWNNSTYAIGMDNNISFGGLATEYAMTFQMNDQATRGFWWGDNAHTDAQGAMALTTQGKLTVAHSARIGYGETDTTTPGATHALDVNGSIQDDKGDVREVSINNSISTTPFVVPAGSSGELYQLVSGASVVNINAANFSQGDIVTIYNHTGSTKTITFNTWSNSVRIAGSSTNYSGTSITLAAYGIASFICPVGNRMVVNGNVS